MSKPVIDPRLFIYSQDTKFSPAKYQDVDVWGASDVLARGNAAPAYRQAETGSGPVQTSGFQTPNINRNEALSDAFLKRGNEMGKNLFGRSGEVAQQFNQLNQFNNQGFLNAQSMNHLDENAELQKKIGSAQTSGANTQAWMSLGSAALGAIGPISNAFANTGGATGTTAPTYNKGIGDAFESDLTGVQYGSDFYSQDWAQNPWPF